MPVMTRYKIIGKVGVAEAYGHPPRIGETLVILGENGPTRFRVINVQHFLEMSSIILMYEQTHSEVYVELID